MLFLNCDVSFCQLTVYGDGYGTKSGYIDQAILIVEPHGAYTEQSLYLSYSDHNQFTSSLIEIVHRFELPANAVINDLWLWMGDSIMQAIMLDTWKARSIYDSIVSKHRDPAFLAKNGNIYELHIYPLVSGNFRKIKLNFITPTRWLGNEGVAELPLKMLKDNNATQKPLDILFREIDSLWGKPYFKELGEQTFYNYKDTLNYKYKRTTIKDISLLPSLTLGFSTNYMNGFFIKTNDDYQDATYFQFGFNPGSLFNLKIDSSFKRILFALDLSGLHNKKYSTLIPNVKQLVQFTAKPIDSINFVVAGANKIDFLASDWKINILDSINNTLDRFFSSTWGSQIANEKMPYILYADPSASICWQFPGLDSLATYTNYSTLLTALQYFHSTDIIAAYEHGFEASGETRNNYSSIIAKIDSFFAEGGRFLSYYDYNRVGNEVIASHYIPGLTTIRRADRSGTLYRDTSGNIGKYFPETIVHYGFDTLSYDPDPNVKVELRDQNGKPVIISKKIYNGLLVVSAIWSFRDDGALRKLLDVPLLGLNASTKNQLLTGMLAKVQSKHSQSPFDKVILLSNSDSLFQKADALNWSSTYLNNFNLARPTFNTINLLDGESYLPVYLTDEQIQYYGSGYLLKTIADGSKGRHFETHLDNWTYINTVLNPYSYPLVDSLVLKISVNDNIGLVKNILEVNPIVGDPNKSRFFIGSTSPANKLQFNIHSSFIGDVGTKDSTISLYVNHDTTQIDKIIPSMLGNEELNNLFNLPVKDTSAIVQLAMRYRLLCDYTALIALEPNDTIHFMKNPFDESRVLGVKRIDNENTVDSITLVSYPNPFNSQITIALKVIKPSCAKIYIYNILGQLVHTIADQDFSEGEKIYHWDGRNSNNRILSSGIYFVRAIVDEKNSGHVSSLTQKILFLK